MPCFAGRLALLTLLAASVVHAPTASAQADAPQPRVAYSPSATAADVPAAAREALGLSTDRAVAAYAEGRAAALALRFDVAREAYGQLAGEPGPAGAYALETMALWGAMITEREPELGRFYTLNDSLADVAGDLPDGPTAEWLRATAALHRALMLAREERYPRAGLAFRDACGRFRDLASGTDPMIDARFGQGVCEVAAGSVPRKYRWLSRLVGFSGTVAGGLAHLTAAADGGGAQAVEAAVVLAMVDQTLNDGRADARARLRRLADAHPGSPILAYLEGYQHFADRRVTEAEVAFRRAAAALAVPGTVPLPTLEAHLGLTLFRQQRFAEAAPMLEGYVRQARGRALVASAALSAGLAYEMAGDRRRAEALYRRVRATRDYDSDLAAAREAERRLAVPLSPTERTLLLGSTAFDAGRYDEAIALLQPVLAGGAPVERAEAAYRTGRAFQSLRRWEEALRHYRLAAANPGDPLARWGPWALFHSGEVLEAGGDTDGARAAYQAVLDNEAEFDFSKALEQRTRAALARLDA